ncbi:ribosomal protein S18B [Nesidiocoris tenuis]|uniref:Small ribosomal subunit protein mS40 n=1 Tax=Nesidiocoris tenuis TaxID=355587 RepID=A0ABN7AIL5_9HEMI|nr:ribosomal protein S18B [Nesidiocoris tenuis]
MSVSSLLRKVLFLSVTPKCRAVCALRPGLFQARPEANSSWLTSYTRRHRSTEAAPEEELKEEEEEGGVKTNEIVDDSKFLRRVVQTIPVETSIRYLKSKAYSITYGTEPVWKNYRRNHKGSIPPRLTRKTCVRAGKIATGNPCPICRDDYLVLSPDNVELLKQFISPHSGETLSFNKTGLCQKQHIELLSAIDIAKDRGSITYDVPFRSYDYSEFVKKN